MINTDLMHDVADAIEANAARFDMAHYLGHVEEVNHCGTTGCIAGWTFMLTHTTAENRYGDYDDGVVHNSARDSLGLTSEEANILFADPHFWAAMTGHNDDDFGDFGLEHVFAAEAAHVLRQIANKELDLNEWAEEED